MRHNYANTSPYHMHQRFIDEKAAPAYQWEALDIALDTPTKFTKKNAMTTLVGNCDLNGQIKIQKNAPSRKKQMFERLKDSIVIKEP